MFTADVPRLDVMDGGRVHGLYLEQQMYVSITRGIHTPGIACVHINHWGGCADLEQINY
jgi:hypothetical protein